MPTPFPFNRVLLIVLDGAGIGAMPDAPDWGDAGDRKTNPGADKIYTIRLRDGSMFRLAGMHIMTKEARHWQWITLWWSDKPKEDFGADRPSALANHPRTPWRNYKMCAVAWYLEEDTRTAAQRFPRQTSLSSALKATSTPGKPTWCSNPYIEHGRGNAATNCIGCHQHGGDRLAHRSILIRSREVARRSCGRPPSGARG